jgi:diaminopimelate epimerase
MDFYKYQGTGNDFILVDDRNHTFNYSQTEIERFCDRRFGIGADGLILLQNQEGFDFRMVYYNADGNEGSMCGNGGRCIVRFAHDLRLFQTETRFLAVDGEHLASVEDLDISLKMSDTTSMVLKDGIHYYNTGSPHLVIYTEELESFDVFKEGKNIRYNEFWSRNGGTNVNFVEVLDENRIKVRTYERGVEDETYSCGTGVTACALDMAVSKGSSSPINILTKGGELNVSFGRNSNGGFENIYLKGPAKRVFNGVLS